MATLHEVKRNAAHTPEFDLIELALPDEQKGFNKVIGIVEDDEAFCEFALDETNVKKKVLSS